MKRIILLLSLLVAVSLQAQVVFQSDFESWTGGVPDGWNGAQTNIGAGNFVEYTTSAQSGTSACQLINTTTSHKRFTTTGLPIVTGESYDVIFWVRGQGEIRTGLFNGVDAGQNVYGSYINVNSTTWTMYTQTLSSNATNSDGEFIFSLRSTVVGNDHLQVDNVTIQVSTAVFDTIPIYDIQYTTDPSGDSPYLDDVLYTYGVVTAAGSSGFFIQDGTGPWSGLYIFNNTYTANVGDSVIVKGKITEYYEMTEMVQVSYFEKLSDATVPAAEVISTADANTEQWESVFVKVMNAECTNTNAGFGMWVVNDGSGTVLIDKLFYEHTPTLGTHYNVTGPVMYSYDEFRIEPRDVNDVEIYTSTEENEMYQISISPNPATDVVRITLPENCDINITNLLGQTVYTTYSNSESSVQLNVSSWENGIYIVNVTGESGVKSAYKLLKN